MPRRPRNGFAVNPMSSTAHWMRVDSVVFLGAFLTSAALVALTIRVCGHRGWVAHPRSDRWHRGTPSLFGGVPICVTCLAGGLVIVPFSNRFAWLLLMAASCVWLLGLVDDILRLHPLPKLTGQLCAAWLVVGFGLVDPLQPNPNLNFAISLLWIVGITNAFNLLDNMDGLAAGVALIAALCLAVFYGGAGALRNGPVDYGRLALLAAGAAGGFLVFNFNPARIFMGDCGSLFLGFLLGCLSLPQGTHGSWLSVPALTPMVVLAIPVFDTVFVSVTRRMRGQAISQGGTDHSSHRLIRLGVNERNAVLLLMALAMMSGAVALGARHIMGMHAVALIGVWCFFLLLFGVYLFRGETLATVHRRNPPHSSDNVNVTEYRQSEFSEKVI
jgi:UDP-GlcNAc:undecaprenyl-phosphate GlcNAc-1-phosphate transferase